MGTGSVGEWFNPADLKSADRQRSVSSNLTASAIFFGPLQLTALPTPKRFFVGITVQRLASCLAMPVPKTGTLPKFPLWRRARPRRRRAGREGRQPAAVTTLEGRAGGSAEKGDVRHVWSYRPRYNADVYLNHEVMGVPTVFKYKGIRFFFYSNEGDPREPLHIHARAGGKEAKLWVQPSVRIAFCQGFSRAEQAELVRVVELHAKTIRSAWNEHFGESDNGSL